MDDENASYAHDSEKNEKISLLDLPLEVLLHICSFLETSTLVHGLSLVCKQLYQILNDDNSIWKTRIKRAWPNAFRYSYKFLNPAKLDDDKVLWKLSCLVIEKQIALWQKKCPMKKISRHVLRHRGVAVLLMHDGAASIVSENGNLIYRKFGSLYNSTCTSCTIDSAHDRFISDLTTINDTIYSCSCDRNVKSWKLTDVDLVHQKTYKMNLMQLDWPKCLSSCPEQNLFAASSYLGNIFIFDSRSGDKPIMQYESHGDVDFISNLTMNSKYILSASEGKTISIWDQRVGRIMKYITIPNKVTCIKMQQDCVCVGDTAAKLHVLNPNNDFELIKSYSTGHTDNITGVHLMYGRLITSSLDGTIKSSIPTNVPVHMATLRSPFQSIRRMDYQKGVLAISNFWEIVVYQFMYPTEH